MSISEQLNPSVALSWHQSGRATVWIGTPDRSVNILNAEMLQGLELALNDIEAAGARASHVLIRSTKEGCFFAGADVPAIAQVATKEEARDVLEFGQALFARIEALEVPTIALIQGTCLGGGLELALACDHRLVVDQPNTKLGLPEIKLGLIPGWGGTQRLPKIVGLQQALTMILTGRTLTVTKALQHGLADAVLGVKTWEEDLPEALDRFLLKQGPSEQSRKRLGWKEWLLERTPVGRNLVFSAAARKLGSRGKHYPALEAAIAVIMQGSKSGWDAFGEERDAFAELLFTDTARSLLGLFLARDEARKSATWLSSASLKPTPVRSVAIVGAGAMGSGIGALAATRGYQVVFKEVDDRAANQGRTRVRAIFDEMLEKKRVTQTELDFCWDRTEFVSDWESIVQCDLAIEAVLEVESVKKEVLEMLDQCLPAESTIATNTSSLCVTRLATATQRRTQVAGLHFFNPVNRMDLVEIVQTESTSSETIARAFQFVKSLGKTPIVTSDKPGFLVNRVLFPYLDEAMRMLLEGYDGEVIDRQMREFGMPMGPLELMDHVGLDIAHHVAQSQMELHPQAIASLDLLKDMVDRGWLGKKSGKGFYNYEGRQSFNDQIPIEFRTPKLGLEFKPDGLSKITRRLVYPILNEAVHCLDEQVVCAGWMVDLGLVLGIGFAPHLGGPMQCIDRIGAEVVLHNLQELQQHYGERFQPADGIHRAVRQRSLLNRHFGILPNPSKAEQLPGTQAWESQDEHRLTQS